MFEEIFFPRTADKYRAAPLVDEARTISRSSQGERRQATDFAEMRQRSIELNAPSEPGRRRQGQCRPDRGCGGDLVAAERTEMHSSGVSQGAQAVRQPGDRMASLFGLAR